MPLHPPFPVAVHDSEREVASGGNCRGVRCRFPLDAALPTQQDRVENVHSTDTTDTET